MKYSSRYSSLSEHFEEKCGEVVGLTY